MMVLGIGGKPCRIAPEYGCTPMHGNPCKKMNHCVAYHAQKEREYVSRN